MKMQYHAADQSWLYSRSHEFLHPERINFTVGAFDIEPLQSNRLKLDFSIYVLLNYKSGIRIGNGSYPSTAVILQMSWSSFMVKRSYFLLLYLKKSSSIWNVCRL